jgi:Major Facilitator Superfamily
MTARQGWTDTSRLRFVLIFGVVNLFADMTYEGARSIIGLYMAGLGASGLAVGAVAGFGELLGYALRLVSGSWADRTRLYWPITLAGYVVQILAERTGRATRTPPRDVMLAEAGERLGRGWAFGVNEALDQLGALIGPLVVAAILFIWRDAHPAFGALAVPALAALILVCGLCLAYPNAGRAGRPPAPAPARRYPAAFWWYLGASSLVAFGFADYSLISYHYAKAAIVPHPWIPAFYALAMGAGGLGSLGLGKLFDRRGLLVLVPLTVVVAAYAPLAFSGNVALAVAGAILWGVGLGAHESVMQAAVAQMIPSERLGSAYGLFGAVFGVAWFLGSIVLGALYDVSIVACVAVAVVAEVLAVPPLVVAARQLRVVADRHGR